MKSQWLGISREARQDIIASLIRENELELAQAEISKIQKQGHFLPPWLRVMLVHALCEEKDFEAILRFAYRLYDNKGDLPPSTWLHLLRHASEHNGCHLMEWIWLHHVEPMYIKPDADTSIKLLKLAAREGKHRIAESAYVTLRALDPESAKQYAELLQSPLGTHCKGMNMFEVFSDEHRNAFSNPKFALRARSRQSRRGEKRNERARMHMEKLKSRRKFKPR